MKSKYIILFFKILLLLCAVVFFLFLAMMIFYVAFGGQRAYSVNQPLSEFETSTDEIKLRKLEKLFVVGDFNGSGVIDTVFQHNYSKLLKAEIDSSACPFQNDWETVICWFINQDANVYLVLNNNETDTLHLGLAQGLYCLVNIGDINSDGKDEIALVIDYLDWSSVNSCQIYTLCDNKWTLLQQFAIHEMAFDFVGEQSPVFSDIKGYLEKHSGTWLYLDYLEYMNVETDSVKMKPLILKKCE